MALVRVHEGERCGTLQPGDVVFDYHPHEKYDLHVGIFVGHPQPVEKNTQLEVVGLPHSRNSPDRSLGVSMWGAVDEYRPDILGQRLDVDPLEIKKVAVFSRNLLLELSQLGTPCTWHSRRMKVDSARRTADGLPLFVQGSCADFVEWLYEQAGLDLVNQEITRAPDRPNTIYPATQIHAFYSSKFPLNMQWDERLRTYPQCLFPNSPDATTPLATSVAADKHEERSALFNDGA